MRTRTQGETSRSITLFNTVQQNDDLHDDGKHTITGDQVSITELLQTGNTTTQTYEYHDTTQID